MKSIILTAVIVVIGWQILAAQTVIDYGFKAGANLSMHYGTKGDDMDYKVQSSYRSGFSSAVFMDLNIINNLALGYEVLYTMKGSDQKITISKLEIDGVMEELVKPAVMNVSYYLDYIEIPVLFKLKVLDKPRLTLSAITGTAMALKVKGKHNLDGIVYFPEGDSYSEIPITEKSDLGDVNMFDYSFVYGGSIEYKSLFRYFLEYRFTLGWDYLSLPTYSEMPPVELRNQTYSLLLGVKF